VTIETIELPLYDAKFLETGFSSGWGIYQKGDFAGG
jgi:hypothetical protein